MCAEGHASDGSRGPDVLRSRRGMDAILNGSASDPRVAWGVDRLSGRRIELVWPPGYQAKFDPQLAIADADGVIVAREGDILTGGCNDVDDPSAPMWVSAREIVHP